MHVNGIRFICKKNVALVLIVNKIKVWVECKSNLIWYKSFEIYNDIYVCIQQLKF